MLGPLGRTTRRMSSWLVRCRGVCNGDRGGRRIVEAPLLCLVRRCLPREAWEVERGSRRHGQCGLLHEKLLEKQ